MSITSMSFLCFLMLGILFYYVLPFSLWKKAVLLSLSIAFYVSFNALDLWFIGGMILFSYCAAFFVDEYRHKGVLIGCVIPVVAGLAIYKYGNLVLSTLDTSMRLIAPLGISFFSFKIIGYLVDVYRGKCEVERSLLNYATYVSFFPQISSGPIQKPDSFLKQIEQVKRMNFELVRHGFFLVFFGYFEKIVIAERLYLLVDHCFADMSALTPSLALIGSVAYAFQLYADFDAYSNIAIGIGELFGISCERNFHAPYLARNIKEFWERWHISLSTWLKDYVYIPLGGSRKGLIRKYFNLVAVFLVSGLWHGTGWNFVLWGVMNGLFRVMYDVLDRFLFSRVHHRFKPLKWVVSLLGVSINFVMVVFLWILFRCSSVEEIRLICG
ncbi:MAG: MBOAT family protein, partial [Erysipelotrichaceae bacterium]|nr:MBOAT family protein [Erysipelotrichaceae bacterium]